MRPSRKVGVVVIVAVAVMAFVFFFAPVVLWFNMGSPIAGVGVKTTTPVYRSLGCSTVGYGDLYAPGWFGFSFGCRIPVPLPT